MKIKYVLLLVLLLEFFTRICEHFYFVNMDERAAETRVEKERESSYVAEAKRRQNQDFRDGPQFADSFDSPDVKIVIVDDYLVVTVVSSGLPLSQTAPEVELYVLDRRTNIKYTVKLAETVSHISGAIQFLIFRTEKLPAGYRPDVAILTTST